MKYRNFRPADKDLSLLGFGTMRMPTLDDGKVDEEEAIKMIRYAIDNGVNYIDTAYMYHGGTSEVIVGKALKDGYREKVFLADKMPVFLMKDPKDMQSTFETQLSRLDTDCIDLYLAHNVSQYSWDSVKSFELFDFMLEKKAEGKIKYIGFSYHGEIDGLFEEVIDAYPWDFCQIQLNYMDKDMQAGLKGYEYAYSKGIPVVIMEPLKGGKLTDSIPPSIQKYWDELKSDRTPAEWAFRWVANLPGVLSILSGMSTMEQVVENVKTLSDAEANSLSEEELDVISRVADEYNKLISFSCTSCRYCLPCPQKINIPQIMDFRNSWDLYDHIPKLNYDFNLFVSKKPSTCVDCGKCVDKCPQHLDIPKAMAETAEIYE